MQRAEDPSFSNVNFGVCEYCSNLVFYQHQKTVDISHGCKLTKDDNGEFLSIDRYEKTGDELTISQKGCNRFEPSGLPAHPIPYEELLKLNPLARQIPVDESATETSFAFAVKQERYLPAENILQENRIRNK